MTLTIQIAGPGLTVWRTGRKLLFAAAALGLATVFAADHTAAQAQTSILNVSYDPTREFYREYNEWFADWWQAQGKGPVEITASHGGSGAQARSVIDGLDAQVLTLALASDIDAVAKLTDLVPEDWQSRLPHNSSPYNSTIVFIVRRGNPLKIKDWDDLIREDVQVITPNPKTSGVARWNFLAAWAWALKEFDGDEVRVREFVGKVYRNVPVLDTGARGSTTTFTQRGVGDVLLNWENEAFLALAELGEDYEIVLPSISVLAEPVVAVVDGNLADDAQRAAAQAYLEQLYSPDAQALAYRHFYRGIDSSKARPEDVARFPEIVRVPITDLGGWGFVQDHYFGDGGVFDQIYED